jgi:hypothetical protein
MHRPEREPEIGVPRRVSFSGPDAGIDRGEGLIVRLSVAGLEMSSLDPSPPAGAEVVVWGELVDGEGVVTLRGRVQWSKSTGFAVQFGLLGPKETRAVVRASARPPPVDGQ